MTDTFATVRIEDAVTVQAPDGSMVKILASGAKGSMAQFSLDPGLTSIAVCHRSVEELWYFTGGAGKMWRSNAAGESVVRVEPGLSLAIAAGTSFQFRSTGDAALTAIGVTMPPWPGMDEAFTVKGRW
jgi:mannose-6-phosphate isomerase-like protein (cupin superfamily)